MNTDLTVRAGQLAAQADLALTDRGTELPGLAAQIATSYALIEIADQLDAIRKHLNTP